MNRIEFCRAAGLGPDACCMAENVHMDEKEYQVLKEAAFTDRERFFGLMKMQEDIPRAGFYFFTRAGMEAKELFEKAGMDEKIYYDTMGDLQVWYENCIRDYGRPGIAQYEWLWRHVTGNLFRLGRLQFELFTVPGELAGEDLRRGLPRMVIPEGEQALNIHIPQGSPLVEEECTASIEEARIRFPGRKYFVCESWLLDPALKELLPPSSRILGFQERFLLCRPEEDYADAPWRIFGKVMENPAGYPENTGLQRSAKRYLLAGGKLTPWWGILVG